MAVRAVAGVVGAAVTLVALAFVLAPDSVGAVLPLQQFVTEDPRLTVVAIAALIGLVSVAFARSGGTKSQPDPDIVDEPPETVPETGTTAPGSALTYRIDRAADGDEGAATDVRDVLRTSALRTLARDPSVDTAAAEERLQSGSWTEDTLAAAYLGGGTLPVSARLREWLAPERERRRRIERTVAAIEREAAA